MLNPMASVWLKTSLVNGLAVAPVIPLLHGWSLYVTQSTSLDHTSSLPYRGSIDALLRTGRGLNVFRGSLPLLLAIPVCTGSALYASISGMMVTANIDTASSMATTLASIGFGEICVQPFRYWYFQRLVTNNSSLEIAQRSTHRGVYRGLGLSMVASAIVQLYPHLSQYYGLHRHQNFHLPLLGATSLISYMCYAMAARRMCTAEGETAPTIFRTVFGGPSLSTFIIPKVSFLFAGIVTMGAARALVSILQTHLSAKATALPF